MTQMNTAVINTRERIRTNYRPGEVAATDPQKPPLHV